MNFLSFLKNLMKIPLDLAKSLTDFLFPKTQEVLALEALSPATLLENLPKAQDLGRDDTVAIFDYSHPVVKEIVWEVKYGGNRNLAKKLGEILYDVIVSELAERGILSKEHSAILMPMPISGKRRFERGWNQSELLAKEVKACDRGRVFRYEPGQLAKIRHTESQTRTASKSEREHNLEKSMRVVNPPSVAGRLVVLIDDVVTTGSTFAEARRALKVAGVRKILCVALAH